MSFNDNFVYRGKRERKKEMQEYHSLIFPFGEAHEYAVHTILQQIIKDKLTQSQRIGIFIAAKDHYLSMEAPNVEKLLNWMNRTILIMPDERVMIAKLVELDVKLNDLLDFPTLDEIHFQLLNEGRL